MAEINIRKGHDIQISGKPKNELSNASLGKKVAIKPSQFRGIKPKLLVKEGEKVKLGTPLFYHKPNPNLTFPSTGCGTIEKIHMGPRRSFEQIDILLSEKEESEVFKAYRLHEINTLTKEEVLKSLLKGCLFPFIRQRPFNKIPDPSTEPRDIFISGYNTSPLSVDIDLALQRKQSQFQAGVIALGKLTKGSVHLTFSEKTVSDTMLESKHVIQHTISGPHPAGNVGVQIHHISPIGLKDTVWVVNAQDVVRIGTFFLTGELDFSLIVSLGGPSVQDAAHFKSRIGASINSIADGKVDENKKSRFISGDVLTGMTVTIEDYLNFYDSTISVIPESEQREFIGMLKPGSSSTRYSLTRAFFGSKNKGYDFNTLKNGSERYMVPLNAWENVIPMDILPNPLYRAILVEDIEEMEQLGILECDDEDFALCSFACPSKIDVGGAIRQGLDLMEKES